MDNIVDGITDLLLERFYPDQIGIIDVAAKLSAVC